MSKGLAILDEDLMTQGMNSILISSDLYLSLSRLFLAENVPGIMQEKIQAAKRNCFFISDEKYNVLPPIKVKSFRLWSPYNKDTNIFYWLKESHKYLRGLI